ncbi:unnamed protein product [Lampetra fluviatilis]
MAEVEEGGAGSSLQALRRDTEGLADAMRQNVERVAQRGDNVDRLLEKGQQLDQSAQQFERVAVRTERRMLWRNRRMKLIIAAVVIVALLIATIAIAIAVHRGGGRPWAVSLSRAVTSRAVMSASHFARLRILQNFSSIISSNIIIRSNSSISSNIIISSSRGRSVPVPRRPHSQLAAPDLALLVCPLSRLPLRLDESGSQLVNDELGLVFPVVEGIPYLTAEDARKITEADSDSDSAAKSGADRPAASEPGAAEPR